MPVTRTQARLDLMVWVLIFAGLFTIVLGIASRPAAPAVAWSLIAVGGVACTAGAVLIWVRSRLGPDR